MGAPTVITVAPRFFRFNDNIIKGNTIGISGTLKISKMTNVSIQNLTNEDNENNIIKEFPTINSIIFDAHKENANAYATLGYEPII